jgi:hypothetical protein
MKRLLTAAVAVAPLLTGVSAPAWALGASVYVSDAGLIKCPANLPRVDTPDAFATAVFKLPKHACWSNSGNGEYIVTIYGIQRATGN